MRGNRVPPGKPSEASAEYLRGAQWSRGNNTRRTIKPRKLINRYLNINTGVMNTGEVKSITKQLKNNQAPGPGKYTIEL